jgi:predicted dithiol-disulfide oxidoreductase (DUF899 family)
MEGADMQPHRIVSREQWLTERRALLACEKAVTKARDEVSRQRRDLPWVKVEKAYAFEGPRGKQSLSELFGPKSQLVIYHFMFGPEWKEGCPGCSFLADHIDGALPHLSARDVTLLAVSRAPYDRLTAFKRRMGWRFDWVSSLGSDFNFDYGVSFTQDQLAKGMVEYNYKLQPGNDELPGISVFCKDRAGDIFHSYSSYGRGGDLLIGAYNYLDLVPKGRDEEGLAATMAWVRHHDRYENGGADPTHIEALGEKVSACCVEDEAA